MKSIKSYLQTHIIVRYASLLLMVTLTLLAVIQYLLKQSYVESLKDNTLQNEKRSMENMAENLDVRMKPYLEVLYDTATEPELLTYVDAMKRGEALNFKECIRVQEFLKNKVVRSNKVLSLMVIGKSGEQIEYSKMDWTQNQTREFFETKDALDLYERVKESGTVEVTYETMGGLATRIHVGVPLLGQSLAKKNIFSIVAAVLNVDFLYDFFSQNASEYVENYLVDQNGKILMCKDQSRIGTVFREAVLEGGYIELEKTVNHLGWKLYSEIDETKLLKDSTQIANRMSLLYISVILCLIGSAIFIFQQIINPMRMLAVAMKDIGEGNMGMRMEVKGQDEVWQVIEKFNIMMEKLENYYEVNRQQYKKMLDMQTRAQKAEFEVLESYINSHFIFNALNVINYQTLQEGNQEASRMIKGLANIMRYAFNSRMQEIYLYQEMLWVEQYLFLQSECNGKKLQFEILMDEKISECKFRKMVLQPFVENSIIHGLKGKTDGRILVQAKSMEGGRVRIVIEDNGCGMEKERQERILHLIEYPDRTNTEGIGIINVVTRMKYYFGEQFQFYMQSVKDEGTKIELIIPFTVVKKEDGSESVVIE